MRCIALLLAVMVLLAAMPTLVQLAKRWLYPRRNAAQVELYAAEYGLDPLLIYAFIRTESGFDARAESSVGARGLMQMTEETFDWIKGKIAPDEAVSFGDLYDPACAVRFGAYYLRLCLDRYGGDVATAAAAYHSGWGTVDGLLAREGYAGDGGALLYFPYSQMNHYVNKILRSYQHYIELYGS